MENNTTGEGSENTPDPSKSYKGEAPPDPSNTSHIGQPIEQGVISKKDGINKQSSHWEDEQERGIAGEGDNTKEKQVENYLKNPSPESMSDENESTIDANNNS